METGGEHAWRFMFDALETFLVEWKPFTFSSATIPRRGLETFLVEWKPDAAGATYFKPSALETFLVEWKQANDPSLVDEDPP